MNEAPNLVDLHREITASLEPWGRSYEVIIVDDGSTDDSFQTLSRIQASDARWRIIRFRRNFGQTAAFSAGFAHANGRYIATADGDLQNDPKDIPAMVSRLESEELDIVCGWRKDRKDRSFAPAAADCRQPDHLVGDRRATARLWHSLRRCSCGGGEAFEAYGEMHRFILLRARGRPHRGRSGQPSGAQARHVEIRYFTDHPRSPRPAHGGFLLSYLDPSGESSTEMACMGPPEV